MSNAVTLKGNAKIAFENTPQIPVVNDLIFYVDAATLGEDITLPYDTIVDFENLEDMRSLFDPGGSYNDRDFNKFSLEFAEGFGKKATNMAYCFSPDDTCSYYDSLTTLVLPKGCGERAESLGGCFSCCWRLSSLTLPEGFGKIATNLMWCFYCCKALRSLTLPDGFGSIADVISDCFAYSNSLTSLHLPEGFGAVATGLSYCFAGCSSLPSLTLPEGFGQKAIALSYCFYNCSSLPSLYLSDGFGKDATNCTGCFSACKVLSTITGVPQFKVSVDFSSCPLNNDSATRIVNGLQTVTETQTITFNATTKTSLTEAGLLDGLVETASNKGWTLA